MIVKNNKDKIKQRNLISNKINISNFEIKDFIEGWAIIIDNKTKKRGWISEDYTKIINPIFDICYNFTEGIAVFEKNGKKGFVNSKCKILGECFDYLSNFKEGIAIFKKGDETGWINIGGAVFCKYPQGGYLEI